MSDEKKSIPRALMQMLEQHYKQSQCAAAVERWQTIWPIVAEHIGDASDVDRFLEYLERHMEIDKTMTEILSKWYGLEMRSTLQVAKEAHANIVSSAARADGGRTTAEQRQHDREQAAKEAARIFDSLTSMSPRNRAAVIAQRMGLSATTVRGYLRDTGKTKGR